MRVSECVSYLDRRDMCMRCVAMYGLHGSKVLVAHVKHLCTFPWSQMCWAVLQGGRLLILVPVLLQETHRYRGCYCVMVSGKEQPLDHKQNSDYHSLSLVPDLL